MRYAQLPGKAILMLASFWLDIGGSEHFEKQAAGAPCPTRIKSKVLLITGGCC